MENNLAFVNVKVKNLNNEYTLLTTQKGKNLFSLLRENGFYVNAYCGGKGVCGKCKVKIGDEFVLSCKTNIEYDIEVELLKSSEEIATYSGVSESFQLKGNPILALDIGTTTLALAIVDETEKCTVEVFTANNPQAEFGGDVISRIDYCKNGGLLELQHCLINKINELIESAFEKYDIKSSSKMLVAGNTTMLHLFFGIDCSSIGFAPYTPTFLEGKTVKGSEIGIASVKQIESLPSIHSFVGSDIVSGLNVTDTPKDQNKYNVLVDLGTNAEIALFSQNRILCTAAAAGPCFEGANISCGMSATKGAINSFKIENANNIFTTIENSAPIGICGTGLIDIISELLKNHIFDETGCLEDGDEYEIAPSVYLTQRDIREFQVAKSAVKSGVEALLKKENITYENVEKLYISGGFSTFINTSNAGAVGLLPSELLEKCISISNSSLSGAISQILNPSDLNQIINKSEYVDLSMDSNFSMLFMENMNFE